jgi:hypothetical protein
MKFRMLPRRGGAKAVLSYARRTTQQLELAARRLVRRGFSVSLCSVTVVFALNNATAATSSPEMQVAPVRSAGGFRGIPWGTPPEAIQAKFGEAAARDEESCNDEFSRQALAAEGHDCVVIAMDLYVLDGIPFSASFRFDPLSKGLDAVVLTSTLKSKNLMPRSVRKVQTECRDSYSRLTRLLATEFSTRVLPHQMYETPTAPFARGSYRAWEGGNTFVRLRRSYDYTDHWKHWRRADGCEIEVRYAALRPDEDALSETSDAGRAPGQGISDAMPLAAPGG